MSSIIVMHYLLILSNLGDGRFLAVSRAECPCTYHNNHGCDLPECSSKFNDNCLSQNDLCEADHSLPGGFSDYDINNCPNGMDVFRYVLDSCKF